MYLPMIPPILFDALTEAQQKTIETIYHQHNTKLLATAKKYFTDQSTAEEAVQTSYVKIIGLLEKNNTDLCSKTAGYFVIIVKNVCIDMIRKQKQGNVISLNNDTDDDEYILEIEDTRMQIDSEIIQKEGYDTIVGYIESLDDKYKLPLYLKFIHNQSEKEIAQTLDLSEKTVNTRIYRGRQILMQKLKEEGYEYNKF